MEVELRKRFEEAGQGHVFRFWEELSENAREDLSRQADAIDLEELRRLTSHLLGSDSDPGAIGFEGIEPALFLALPENGGDSVRWQEAAECGEEVLRAGRVAAFTVAGGQGTRLGYDGPKGTFPVTPVRKNTLFQVFAEKILAASRRHGVTIPWFIMTSEINHEATLAAFREANYFGLPES